MKKFLLASMAALSLSAAQNANAQLAMQNFNSASLPSGWTLINDGHTVLVGSFILSSTLATNLTNNAWYPVQIKSSTDYSMLTVSQFSPSAQADRWLISPSFQVTSANTVLQWDDYSFGSNEGFEIKVSPTAGTTAASFTATIYSGVGDPNNFVTHQLQIGQYNGQTITVAFRDTMNNNWGLAVDNIGTTVLPTLDLGVTALNLSPFVQTNSSNSIAGVLHNYGYATLTSCNINYSVNGGAPVTSALSSLSVASGTDYNYTNSTPWVPTSAGNYTIKVWADQINGATGVDQNHANDTLTATILVIDTLQPKTVMIEEFTQASCDPCAQAHTNVDTVYANSMAFAEICRYHVNWPGRDCMDSVTLTPFVSTRVSYYSVSGVPDAQLDGSYIYPGAGGLSTPVLYAESQIGSPFTITVNPTFNAATQTFSFTAAIKAYGALPAGLRAYVVLTEDTLTYAANQSTESISQTVFPQVAENMFPNGSGYGLSAFTAGSTQNINGSWVKNHPWASNRSVWSYDSSMTGRIIVWVEDDTKKFVYQAKGAPVSTGVVGIEAVKGNSGSMDVYPNPAKNSAVVGLNLTSDEDVKLEVYNILGQLVFEMPTEHRNAGNSVSTINTSNFANGQYMVKVIVGADILTKQIVVSK